MLVLVLGGSDQACKFENSFPFVIFFLCILLSFGGTFWQDECTSNGLDKKGCSIEEVMKEFHSVEEVVFGSELYCFATEFFIVRSRREMWAAIGDMDRKFQWLKLMFDRRASYRPWFKRLQYQSLWWGAMHEVLLRLCCCQMVDANGSVVADFSQVSNL